MLALERHGQQRLKTMHDEVTPVHGLKFIRKVKPNPWKVGTYLTNVIHFHVKEIVLTYGINKATNILRRKIDHHRRKGERTHL